VCCLWSIASAPVTQNGAPTEGDELNVVWVVDSESLPFYRGEVYHQFHNGLGKGEQRSGGAGRAKEHQGPCLLGAARVA
jgi:hypothetical protein